MVIFYNRSIVFLFTLCRRSRYIESNTKHQGILSFLVIHRLKNLSINFFKFFTNVTNYFLLVALYSKVVHLHQMIHQQQV